MIEATATLMRRYRHINWALADQTMVSGVNFLTGILLARYLGIEEFGRFTLMWVAVLFVNSIQHAAISSPMMSIGPKQHENEEPAYYGALVIHQIIFSCVAFFVLAAGIRLSGTMFPEWKVSGLAFSLAAAACAFQLQEFVRRYFFARGRVASAFFNDAIRYLGQITILIWLFVFLPEKTDIAKVLWIIALTAVVAAISGVFLIERIKINLASLRTTTTRHWHFSKWLIASSLAQWLNGNYFVLTAGALLGTMAVGALMAAQSLMGVVHILFMGLGNIVPVRAARHFHRGGNKALGDYLKQVLLFGGGATAFISLVAALAPELWLGWVFGQEYRGYGYLLQWYAAIYILIFMALPLHSGLRAIEQSQTIFWAYLSATLFSVLAAYPMTSYLGLTGVMSGIAIANLIIVISSWFGLQKRLI